MLGVDDGRWCREGKRDRERREEEGGRDEERGRKEELKWGKKRGTENELLEKSTEECSYQMDQPTSAHFLYEKLQLLTCYSPESPPSTYNTQVSPTALREKVPQRRLLGVPQAGSFGPRFLFLGASQGGSSGLLLFFVLPH